MAILAELLLMRDRRVLRPLGQHLRRTAERGGVFRDYERGISLGWPLRRSPRDPQRRTPHATGLSSYMYVINSKY